MGLPNPFNFNASHFIFSSSAASPLKIGRIGREDLDLDFPTSDISFLGLIVNDLRALRGRVSLRRGGGVVTNERAYVYYGRL